VRALGRLRLAASAAIGVSLGGSAINARREAIDLIYSEKVNERLETEHA